MRIAAEWERLNAKRISYKAERTEKETEIIARQAFLIRQVPRLLRATEVQIFDPEKGPDERPDASTADSW